jgi:hypothetical protein
MHPGLCQIITRLHPEQRIRRNAKRLFKAQRHRRGQAGMSIQEHTHILAADAEMQADLCHRHAEEIEIGPSNPSLVPRTLFQDFRKIII